MLPKRFYKIFGFRVKLMELGGGTYYNWDKETEQLVPGKPYQIINMWAGFYGGGTFFVGVHIIQMYLKTQQNEIFEEGETEHPPMQLHEFATMMIEGGEILLVTCLSFLNLIFLQRLEIFQKLFNEMINYNKKMFEMAESGKLVLNQDQKNIVKLTEFLLYAVMFISAILPFGVVASVMTKIEPTHQIIYEWLEVRFQLNWGFSPFIVMMVVAAYGVGTTVSLMMILIAMYYMTTTVCVDAFTPEEFQWTPKLGRGRCELMTKNFGTISDLEVVILYRTQQMLNILLNTFFKSVLVSFHQVGCLATVVVLLVFMVRFDSVLSEHGPIGYVVVTSSMMAPLLMIYFQARMAGDVVDISEDFKFSGTQLVPRKMMFRKFTRSCTTFYIQVAYPYYTIHKETFASFMEQAQDYSMELLLW